MTIQNTSRYTVQYKTWNQVTTRLPSDTQIAIIEGISMATGSKQEKLLHYQYGDIHYAKCQAITELDPKPTKVVFFVTGELHRYNKMATLSDEAAKEAGKQESSDWINEHTTKTKDILEAANIKVVIKRWSDFLNSENFNLDIPKVKKFYEDNTSFHNVIDIAAEEKANRDLKKTSDTVLAKTVLHNSTQYLLEEAASANYMSQLAGEGFFAINTYKQKENPAYRISIKEIFNIQFPFTGYYFNKIKNQATTLPPQTDQTLTLSPQALSHPHNSLNSVREEIFNVLTKQLEKTSKDPSKKMQQLLALADIIDDPSAKKAIIGNILKITPLTATMRDPLISGIEKLFTPRDQTNLTHNKLSLSPDTQSNKDSPTNPDKTNRRKSNFFDKPFFRRSP